MDKHSTLSYFFNTYHNEKISFEKLDLSGEELKVSRSKEERDIFTPSTKSINAILSFAKSYEVLHSKAAGCIEMNKN